MPSSECDSEALQEALRHFRRAHERRQNTLAELQQFKKELDQDKDTETAESVKKIGELIEMTGQIGGTMEKPSAGSGLETLGKLVSMISAMIIEDVRAGNLAANRAERLRILQEALRLDLEEEMELREKAMVLLDEYWACTERMAPRRLRFALTIRAEGGFLGITARSEVAVIGEAGLECMDPCTGSLARLGRWMHDPELGERYSAKGEATLSVPLHEWTSTGAPVRATNVTHEESGGPLTFDAVVRWLRGRPDTLELLRIPLQGTVTQHVQGEVEVFGQGQSFSSDQDLGQVASRMLWEHAGLAEVRIRMCAEASTPWHGSDALTHASSSSALELTITR